MPGSCKPFRPIGKYLQVGVGAWDWGFGAASREGREDSIV